MGKNSTSLTFTTTSYGGWGAEHNLNGGNVYSYTWQYKLDNTNTWVTVSGATDSYSIGGGGVYGTSIIDLLSLVSGDMVRCIVGAKNHTGSFCEEFTNVITI